MSFAFARSRERHWEQPRIDETELYDIGQVTQNQYLPDCRVFNCVAS